MRSMAEMTDEMDGIFPHWPIASNEASCMVGSHGAALMVEVLESSHKFDNIFNLTAVQQVMTHFRPQLRCEKALMMRA